MPLHALTTSHRMLLGSVGGAMIALSSPAANAESLDCDKLAHTSEPYEVTLSVANSELTYQVYRSKTPATTLIARGLDGLVTKLQNDGTFPKSLSLPNGQGAVFEYSIPTDKPIYDQAVKEFTSKLRSDKNILMDNLVHMEYLPDAKLSVGSCTFNTKHYVQTISKNGRESRNEIWFSPELQLGIKIISTLKSGDQHMEKQTVATKLATDFKPLK